MGVGTRLIASHGVGGGHASILMGIQPPSGAPTPLHPAERDMAFNNIFQLTVWADYGNEQNTLAHRRGRFTAPTADLSAFDGWSDVRMKYSMCMIVPTADVSALVSYPDIPIM